MAGAGVALAVAVLLWAPATLAYGATNDYAASVTPASITAGAQGSFTVTWTDDTSSQEAVQYVQVTVPSGFTAPTVGAITQPAGAGFAATLTGNVVTLTTAGAGLSSGQSVSVTITATAPQTPGTYTLATDMQHDGDSDGDDNFTLIGSAPTVTVINVTPTALAIVGQPSTTQVNTAMNPAVVVDVEDSSGIDIGYNGPVELTYAAAPSGYPLPQNNVVNAVSGIATFPALTFGTVEVASPLELQADIPGTSLVSPPSSGFNIATEVTTCPGGTTTCQSGTVTDQGTSESVNAAAAPTTDILALTAGGFGPLSCTTIGGTISFTLTNRAKTITMTLAKDLVQQSISEGASKFNICWGQSTAFTVLGGGQSMQANGEYEGLLPDCTTGGPSPCVSHRNKNKGREVVTVSAPAGDPRNSF